MSGEQQRNEPEVGQPAAITVARHANAETVGRRDQRDAAGRPPQPVLTARTPSGRAEAATPAHATVPVLSRITFLAPPQPIRSTPRFPGRGASLRVRCGPTIATQILFAFRDAPQGLSARR